MWKSGCHIRLYCMIKASRNKTDSTSLLISSSSLVPLRVAQTSSWMTIPGFSSTFPRSSWIKFSGWCRLLGASFANFSWEATVFWAVADVNTSRGKTAVLWGWIFQGFAGHFAYFEVEEDGGGRAWIQMQISGSSSGLLTPSFTGRTQGMPRTFPLPPLDSNFP